MKILTTTLKMTFIAILLTALPVIIFTFITAKNPTFGIESFVVLSGSMTPTLPVGSVIYTQQKGTYEKGDIIAFKDADKTITHRIAKVNSDGTFVTKGDANKTADSKTVSPDNVLGKNVYFLPYVGRAIEFFRTPIGFFGSIVFPLTVFVVLESWNLKKEIEKEFKRKVAREVELVQKQAQTTLQDLSI